MLALTLRRSSHASAVSTDNLSQRSWDMLVDAYRRYEFDESYFQALCLLAQVDHAEGRSNKARTQVALGLKLAQARGWLNKVHYEVEHRTTRWQHQEIVWSLFMLDRCTLNRDNPYSTIPDTLYKLPAYKGGPTHPGQSGEVYDATLSTSPAQSFVIVGLFAQIMRMWELVIQYIGESLTTESKPIWHHKSTRTAILTSLLELEIPSEPHTYASVGPVDRVLSAPASKPYFQTWMFLQITHSAINCCINHPFIIFVKARQHGSRVPLTFLQRAHKDSLIYASWITRNLTDMETARLDVLDPFLAYLVGIAASIHIEHSLSSNASSASSARQKMATCMAYLTRVAGVWPQVKKRINVLEELRSRVGSRSALHYVDDEYDGGVPVRSVRHVSMSVADERLMWALFDASNDTMADILPSANISTGSAALQLSVPQPLPDGSVCDVANSMPQSQSSEAGPSHDIEHMPTIDQASLDVDLTADWSLLGVPWLAYFPPDTDLLGCQ
ncbi:hypothetical protein C7974DRAFT_408068 [Boeremia exigua]|uniref:uncharacterized protein n=1 Tax=Boeremia exigua TaxID=749465 RepID=UPI001E8E2EAE|nr:uncharacterized protein C7974DRAFT_408068 [Boeremia exigua]KAH6644385.1 hypothetical protein C7974DRAFT_408068 [Boeremia exigua]